MAEQILLGTFQDLCTRTQLVDSIDLTTAQADELAIAQSSDVLLLSFSFAIIHSMLF